MVYASTSTSFLCRSYCTYYIASLALLFDEIPTRFQPEQSESAENEISWENKLVNQGKLWSQMSMKNDILVPLKNDFTPNAENRIVASYRIYSRFIYVLSLDVFINYINCQVISIDFTICFTFYHLSFTLAHMHDNRFVSYDKYV